MKLKRNIVKICSLALGLAIGVVLIAKVCFELSYDNFYSDKERVYSIMTGAVRHGEENLSGDRVSGAVAPGFKEFVPGVETATRITPVFENNSYYTQDKNKLEAELVVADTCFFDIFDMQVYTGDPKQVLSQWGKMMVSRTLAEKLGGIEKAVGQTLYNESLPKAVFTVEGVFEDFPTNSTFRGIDILLAMPTYSKSSTENWLGNDRYLGYVKLQEGVDPESLTDAIHEMQVKNQPMEDLEKAGLKLWYYLERTDRQHVSDPTNRNMILMLSIVALLLISAAVVNYVLNSISSVVQRAKEVGVRKCYGAEEGDIAKLLFKEAALHFSIALILASAIILGAAKPIENLLGASLGSLFSWQTIAVAAAVSIVVLLISGLVPANIFMRVPVSTAFRNYRESKRRWKLVFLGIQFTFSIFLVCVLFVFGKQYNMMLNDDLGYEYGLLVAVDMPGANTDEYFKIKDKVEQLPFVIGTAITSEVPITGSSGNNVYLPGDDRELFNIADQYYSTEGAADVLGIKFIEGREAKTSREVAVSRKFVEKMQGFADWSDGAIGKGLIFTQHSSNKNEIFTVCGVYEDYKIGAIYVDERPSVRFGAELSFENDLQYFYLRYVLIKVDEITAENISQIQKAVDEVIPERTFEVAAYEEGVRMFFADIRKIKNAILLGGLFSLIISLMGLIGYIRDETQRRSAEVAIRKINGAVPAEIVKLFVGDIMTLMAAALVIGDILALLVGNAALEMFQQKAEIGILSYVIGDIIVLTIIMAVVIAGSLKISNSNPVDSLKNE